MKGLTPSAQALNHEEGQWLPPNSPRERPILPEPSSQSGSQEEHKIPVCVPRAGDQLAEETSPCDFHAPRALLEVTVCVPPAISVAIHASAVT